MAFFCWCAASFIKSVRRGRFGTRGCEGGLLFDRIEVQGIGGVVVCFFLRKKGIVYSCFLPGTGAQVSAGRSIVTVLVSGGLQAGAAAVVSWGSIPEERGW